MESEERPAKMRKVEHKQEMDSDTVMDAVPPAATEPGEEIIGTLPTTDKDTNENATATPISKNQLKKQRKLERWESGREDRKVKRKEKIKEKRERKRATYAEMRANGEEITVVPRPQRGTEGSGKQAPITIVFDCDFDDLMFDHELKSLGLQITRCYSDNRKAPFRVHMGVSSWGGKLKERFDGILAKQYTSWKGVHFCPEDFVEVSEMAKEWMKGEKGGPLVGALQQSDAATAAEEKGEEAEAVSGVVVEEEGEVVYLSAESDVTLERLKPNSTYIIGGLVDKNRHKGICYKRAVERGMKTAKLPIGEFLQMKSRQVLTTNHVMEIMLRWLEYDDWGKAFISVLPKRKGGVLRSEAEQDGEDDTPGAEDDAEAAEVVEVVEATEAADPKSAEEQF